MEYENGTELGENPLTESAYEKFVSERLREYYNNSRDIINMHNRPNVKIDINLARIYRDSD